MRPGRALLASLLLVGLATAGCGDDGDGAAPAEAEAGASQAPLPDSLVAYVDQARTAREGREVFVRLVHEGEGEVTALRAEVVSDRFEPVTWTGEKTFMNEADLDFELPVGRCGTGSDAEVRLTYRLDDGPELVSTTLATDRYGALGLFLDRDCAEQTMAEAAEVVVGEPRVVGAGRSSTFELPVGVTATGDRPDVAFAGFEGTVLFNVGDRSPLHGESRPVTMSAGATVTMTLRITPTRCDPHALAEDKVGTLFPTHVEAPDVVPDAFFYLPLSDETRGDLRRFFGTHCGL